MRVMDMILNEPESQSQSPIVVAPSDESSQSTSGLDSLVPGIEYYSLPILCTYKQTHLIKLSTSGLDSLVIGRVEFPPITTIIICTDKQMNF